MLLIEKVIKLLDDFHFDTFHKHVKSLSVRSYYPLALIDVINRDLKESQSIEGLCRKVYDEYDEGTHKKFIQLAHHTFRLTSFLAKNYPNYLFHNISKVQLLINSGESEQGLLLLQMLSEVCAKVEDRNTELTAQQILAQHYILTEKRDQAIKCFERSRWCQIQKNAELDIIQYMHTHHALRASNTISKNDLEEHLTFFAQYKDAESFYVRFLQKCVTYFFMHLARDRKFYSKEVFEDILECEKEYEKCDYVVTPFLANYIHVLKFLKLNHFITVAAQEEVSKQIPDLLADGEELQFWESYFNMTEFSSIVILTNFFSKNYFQSYKENHLDELSQGVKDNLDFLKKRCETILEKPQIEEKFIIRYINLSTLYSLLLICGDEKDLKKATGILEGLLTNYQQIPFYGFSDSIYGTLALAYFCMEDFENVDRCYRRFKKNMKHKTVNVNNDFFIQGIFFITKWRETKRNQYLKKLEQLFQDSTFESLDKSKKQLSEIMNYFQIKIPLEK